MRIQAASQTANLVAKPVVSEKTETAPAQPTDSVQKKHYDAGEISRWSLAGATPLVGAGANVLLMFGGALTGKQEHLLRNLAGAAANVAGTVSLVAGLATGYHLATYAGAGLLAASGAAGGMGVAQFE